MFDTIADALDTWAVAHQLHWQRLYKDSEVRSLDLTLSDGRIAQIWVDGSSTAGWSVNAWDRKAMKFSRHVADSTQMGEALSEALSTVRSW
ncbi:hypothetical protein DT603_14265 [Pseudoxanthomonas gei]|uniref:Uncharacterized protein n=1 Tax=Pseudoxanthomonas gei TaxID=1383030 RepID=A0ABX0AEH7_9GAMM|nr:hypothetical protein [Pseudoxanthomonas gei]